MITRGWWEKRSSHRTVTPGPDFPTLEANISEAISASLDRTIGGGRE